MNGNSVTEYACAGCSVTVTRPPTRGQRPKWCPDCRGGKAQARVKAIQCAHCGADAMTWRAGRFCSRECASAAQVKPKPPKTPSQRRDLRSELRRGYEDGDDDLFFAALVANSDTTGACWVWRRLNKSGYPAITWAGKDVAVHRIVLEMKHGAPLGSQHAHHTCANTSCVNPDHLQPVTHRDNVAEMLARRSYMSRINELESALAVVSPDHPLLRVISVA